MSGISAYHYSVPIHVITMTCSSANAGMSASAMADLIRRSPPGPWPEGWAGWDCTRDAHLILQRDAIDSCPPPPGNREGRGIVTCASAKPGWSSGKQLSHGYLPSAWVLVQRLRALGCTLPITVAHRGPLEWDIALTRLLAPYGVTCLDLQEYSVAHPIRILGGWESKVHAVLGSGYRDVLYLDADVVPLRDPTFLLRSHQHRHYGSIWWPDVPPYDRAEWLPECVWRNVGLTYRDEVDFESGQFTVDTVRCWRELDLTRHFNDHSDYYYRFVFGDKSTYHLSWAVLGRLYAIPPRLPGGSPSSLHQHDFDGQVLFDHLTRNKPTLSGYPHPQHLLCRSECETALSDLRTQWCGRLWDNTDPSRDECEIIDRMIGVLWHYERVGLGGRYLRTLTDSRIGEGWGKCEHSWHVWIDEQGALLVICDWEGIPVMTMRSPDGSELWRGRWLEHERCEVTLTSLPEGAE